MKETGEVCIPVQSISPKSGALGTQLLARRVNELVALEGVAAQIFIISYDLNT